MIFLKTVLFLFCFLKTICTIQLIIFDDWTASYNVCSIAINDAKQEGLCTTKVIDINRRRGCGENHVRSASYAIEVIATSKEPFEHVFVGPTCSADIRTISDFADIWKTPVIGYAQIPENLYPPKDTKSMINVVRYSISGIVESTSLLLNVLKQEKVSLIGPNSHDYNTPAMCSAIRDYNAKTNKLNIQTYLEIDENEVDWTKAMKSLEKSARTILICSEFFDTYSALYNLGIKNLFKKRFIIILLVNKPIEEIFYQQNSKNLIYDSSSFIVGPAGLKFSENYALMVQSMPDLSMTKFTAFLYMYNACYAYCVGSTIGAETYVDNYIDLMNERTISNKYGNFTFDESGEVLSDYAVYTLSSEDMLFEVVMAMKSIPKACDNLVCYSLSSTKFESSFWDLADMALPDACNATDTCSNYLFTIIASIVIAVLFFAFGAGLVLQRRHRNNAFKMTWKIPKTELKIIVNKNADQKMQRELEIKKNESKNSDGLAQRKRVFASYALVGTQRAEFMSFKQVAKYRWQESQLKYLYTLKQLQNDNLTKFLGIMCNESNAMYFLSGLIDRATLEDFCYDETFKMNDTFKSAFMRDICKGLSFLHKSSIGYHGILNSSTCLIDTNWVLKLTFFGISNIISDLHKSGHLVTADLSHPTITNSQYAWFAPEHLKEYDPEGKKLPQVVRGSDLGDIYSLALVFYQMVYRKDPFSPPLTSLDRASPTLINDIINNNLRPKMVMGTPEDALLDMCQKCWDRDPAKRPTIKSLSDCINLVYPTAKGNLVDQMIKISETLADDLEHTVAERTAEIAEAEMRTMILLNEMLPAPIAKALKEGKRVAPRSYPSATVMFVQICDFPILMASSSPDQIIYFLNDIFDQFDKVIRRHDAYKVETTGETYMVASGVPNENDGQHIVEVAEVSLEIRDLSYIYVVEHKPDFKVCVKIGFHAGPIAAGVIGLKSPRYCLFGDTVNFASRMQSNCPRNQIQTSEQTAKLLNTTHEYKLVKRGIVHVKGKGEVNCYWLNEHIHEKPEEGNDSRPLTKAGNVAQLAKTVNDI